MPRPLPEDAVAFASFLADRAGVEAVMEQQIDGDRFAQSVVLLDCRADDGDDALAELTRSRQSPLLIVGVSGPVPEHERGVSDRFRSVGFAPVFSGTLRSGEQIVVVEDAARPLSPTVSPPSEFSVLAVMTAYNEADIIAAAIDDLHAQGVEVHVIDNWSDDATAAIAEERIGRGVTAVERFPVDGPTGHYDSRGLLRRVEQISHEGSADWFIKHDVDEVRRSPWRQLTLREAIYVVDRAGYDCIDFTVAEFRPVGDDFESGTDHVRHFRHFEWGRNLGHFAQVKAWKPGSRSVDLVTSGGHRAELSGMRVHPYKFLLQHYPIRSQTQGERKIFQDRRARLDPGEIKRGWHMHYKGYGAGHQFIVPRDDLEVMDDTFHSRYLVERLSGVGIMASRPTGPIDVPSWASVLREGRAAR
ncbi:hypothetical protein BH23ACT3_BH23ACT3_01460 [soil metagenome]